MSNASALDRRTLLRGGLGAAATFGLGAGLAGCATPGGGGGGDNDGGNGGASPSGGGGTSADNPFGLAETGTIDAVIFNGGYGTDYVSFAGEQLTKKWPGVTATIKQSTDIAGELQPRFVGGNPPDLIDNSGAKSIGMGTILNQLADLSDVIEATNYEGEKIADTLLAGTKDAGTFDGHFAALNYVLSIFGVWYSASLFEENGWTPPKTWDEIIALGAEAKAKDKYLWLWGKEAATYYQTLCMDSAIKQGGDAVRLPLENLEPDCWSIKEIQDVFNALGTCVKEGYFKPGGSGTQFTAAQAQWSSKQEALLYPSGSWIENEMKSQTADNFQMTGINTPVVDEASAALGYTAEHSTAGEPFIIPAKAKNLAGGKELLRAMLSKEAAANFAKEKLAPTVVKGTVPDDGFGSTALLSQSRMLEAAGDNVFTTKFVGLYGMNQDQLVVWNSFLDGKTDVAGLTKGLQDITDKVREDPNVDKIEVK